MAYDELLADRARQLMKHRKGFSERKMFGGVGFLIHGNMCVGIWKEFLIVRIGVDDYESALEEPHTRVFDITGKVMKGWLMIEPAGLEIDEMLREWISWSVKFVRTLPAK